MSVRSPKEGVIGGLEDVYGDDGGKILSAAALGAVCLIVLAVSFGVNGAAYSTEPSIVSPECSEPVQSFVAPVQTGVARFAAVNELGLYQIPPKAAGMYCLGRQLPALPDRLVFVRTVDDFYARGNIVWAGTLNVRGDPGALPPPAAQARVGDGGVFTATFRKEEDKEFQYNHFKPPAPNWYFPKPFHIVGVRPLNISPESSMALLRTGFLAMSLACSFFSASVKVASESLRINSINLVKLAPPL